MGVCANERLSKPSAVPHAFLRLTLVQWFCHHCKHKAFAKVVGLTGRLEITLDNDLAFAFIKRYFRLLELAYVASLSCSFFFLISDGSRLPRLLHTELKACHQPWILLTKPREDDFPPVIASHWLVAGAHTVLYIRRKSTKEERAKCSRD